MKEKYTLALNAITADRRAAVSAYNNVDDHITNESDYFYGNRVSDYGRTCCRLDYATLSKAFNHVYVSDSFISAVYEAGYDLEPCNATDYESTIETLREKLETIEDIQADFADDETDDAEKVRRATAAAAEDITEMIHDLEEEAETEPEVFQWYIVDDNGADIIRTYTDDPLYYVGGPFDLYLWGVTHWGTAWTHVCTITRLDPGSYEL